MAQTVKQLVTKWIYKVDTSQLKKAEQAIIALEKALNAQLNKSNTVLTKQATAVNKLGKAYKSATTHANRLANAKARNRFGFFGGGRGGGGRGGGRGMSARFGASGLSTLGIGGEAIAAAGVLAGIKKMATLGATFEASQMTFATMLKSDEKANELLMDLRKFAAKTPFELTGIRATAQRILGSGYTQEQVIPLLQRVGDLAQGDQAVFNRLLINISEIKNNGKAFTRDIRQFATAGIDMVGALSTVTGKTRKEVGEMIGQGKISNELVQKAITFLVTKGPFAGSMQNRSQTLLGQLSNLIDTIVSIGEDSSRGSFLDLLKSMTQGTKGFLEANRESLVNFFERGNNVFGTFFRDIPKAGDAIRKLLSALGITDGDTQTSVMAAFGTAVALAASKLMRMVTAIDFIIKGLAYLGDEDAQKEVARREVEKSSKQLRNFSDADLQTGVRRTTDQFKYKPVQYLSNLIEDTFINPIDALDKSKFDGFNEADFLLEIKRREAANDAFSFYSSLTQANNRFFQPDGFIGPRSPMQESAAAQERNIYITIEGDAMLEKDMIDRIQNNANGIPNTQ